MTNFVFCFLINQAVTGFLSVLIISPYCLPVLLPRLTFDPKVFFFLGGGGEEPYSYQESKVEASC